MQINHYHFQDQESSKMLVEQIEGAAVAAGLDQVRLVGKIKAQNVFISLIQKDFSKFLIGSLLLAITLLLLIFRNLRAALLPFLISFVSLIWLFGLIASLGIKINLLSSLLPPIIFFTSMSDAVHLMNAVYKTDETDRIKRLQTAAGIVWVPTLLTSVTTAIGFLSLLFINTEPIQQLGIFAGVGILIAFLITFTFGLLGTTYITKDSGRNILPIPSSLLQYLLNNRKRVVVGGVIIILLVLPGISRLEIDAYLLDDLPADSPVRADFEFSDQQLGGTKPYEIRIDAIEGTIWDKQNLDEIKKIEDYLGETYGIGRIQGPAALMKYLNQTNNGGLAKFYQYPTSERQFQRARSLLRRLPPEVTKQIVTEDQTSCRIIGFFPEMGSKRTIELNEKMLMELQQLINSDRINYRITGTTFLIDKSHELLSMNLIKGLLIAILIISIILGLYFKSVKLTIVSLVPNLVPLLMVAGIIGVLGITLKMTTAIIFTIAFGIAVDDTIHMMSYYLRNKSAQNEQAMRDTFHHAGSAMLITSIIMIAGFAMFLVSSFGATFYLGLFVSLALLVALIVDLTLLPILLLSFDRKDAEGR